MPHNKPHSETAKRKISSALMGKHHSDETRYKMSLAHKNRRQCDEIRRRCKISATKKGCSVSLETRIKLRDANKGSNHPNWKGGITPKYQQIRNSPEFKQWQRNIFKRDNYIDQKYGTRGGNLHAHHILNFAEHPDLRFNPDNGITLSKRAHEEFHRIYGKKHNTREQLMEFLSINSC